MKKQWKRTLKLLTFIPFAAIFFPCMGTVIIDGTSFNFTVLDGTSADSNYSCIQNGETDTLSSRQPTISSTVTYFLNHLSYGEESAIAIGVNTFKLIGVNPQAGIMICNGQATSTNFGQNYVKIYLDGVKYSGSVRSIWLETHSLCSNVPSNQTSLCCLNCTLPVPDCDTNTVYLMIKMKDAFLHLYYSMSPIHTINDTGLVYLGATPFISKTYSYGMFIKPCTYAPHTDFDKAAFSSMLIIPRDSADYVDSLSDDIIRTPMKFIQDIKNQYIAGGNSFTDPFQKKIFDNMTAMKNQYAVKTISGNEMQSMDTSLYNAKIYLADIVHSYITDSARTYPVDTTTFNLYYGFSLNLLLQQGINTINTCSNAGSVNWWDFFNPLTPLIKLIEGVTCEKDFYQLIKDKSVITEAISNKDGILMDAASYIEYLTMMCLLDNSFYDTYKCQIISYIEQVRAYTKKIAPVYYNNNIPMKVFSAIAFWDLAHKSQSSSKILNSWLKDKFMESGAYAEGSHYLDWLNQELLPYYYFSTYNGWLPDSLQLPRVKKSGYWLLNMADKSGVIAPIDDGTNDEQFWLSPYTYLNNDNVFKNQDSISFQGEHTFINDPMRFLTYQSANFTGQRTLNTIGVYEGIGKINITSKTDSADLSVTLVTETTGDIKTKGGPHDQQDDGSISLRRVKKTSNIQVDNLIFDPGYAGFKYKGKEEYFCNHNTVQINPYFDTIVIDSLNPNLNIIQLNFPYGGINSCAMGDWSTCAGILNAALGINIESASAGIVIGALLLVGVSPINDIILSLLPIGSVVGFNWLSDNVSVRIGAGGPGYSDMASTYYNGFMAKITYDTKTDNALRTVLHVDDEIFVVDRISSDKNYYSVHYNMPDSSYGSGNIYYGKNGNSKIRLSGFCSDSLNPVSCIKDSFGVNENVSNPLRVTSIRYSNSGKYLPSSGAYCSFLTVLEPSDANFSYGNPYTTVSGDVGNAQICVSHLISNGIARYAFVNTVTNGVKGTVKIPAKTGWNHEFTTDAEYGIIDFDTASKSVVSGSINLYNESFITYNGQSLSTTTDTLESSRVIPILDTVTYIGSGMWRATFGYSSTNAYPVEISAGEKNGFFYQENTNLNLGQPVIFNPGVNHSAFTVDFDGSRLVWTLNDSSVTAQPGFSLKVQMKDNGFTESNISKPQIRITNNGGTALSGFTLRLWFSREEYFSQQIIADKYYVNPSGITLSQNVLSANANIVYVDVTYPSDYQLAAGTSTTDDGVQLGVHFNNYYPGSWTKSNDWSWQGITGTFSETKYVTVYDQNGVLIYGNEPGSSSATQPPSISTAEIFGFEKTSGWIAPAGICSLSTTIKTQGSASLRITGGGYQEINSIDMSTAKISGIASNLKMDVYIGPTQPNNYWVGQIQLYVSCPSAGLYNVYIGQSELTNLTRNAFNTVSFSLPSSVLSVLLGNYSDFSFKWVLNTNANSGPYYFDNMLFSAQ